MAGNSIGTLFRLTTFGESHGPAIGGVLDGCPAGLELDLEAIQNELNRRRPGQSSLTTSRTENDEVEWLSGLFEGKTTGAPIAFQIPNQDARPADYTHIKEAFRPSHADYATFKKYGLRDHRGGGRSSARETVARVVGGAIALQCIAPLGIQVSAYVERVKDVAMDHEPRFYERHQIDTNPVRCPEPETAQAMSTCILEAKKAGDTVGGSIVLVVRGVPAGWGEPVFDKLQAALAHALWSLPAVKGMELGSGFEGTRMMGSDHNDAWVQKQDGDLTTKTNNSGGIQGGISNGNDIVIRLAFKPVSTLLKPQDSFNTSGESIQIEGRGRHDPCVLPRAVPLVESMVLLVLADHWLKNKGIRI
ncbi:MAG: chorismate synthase [Flavobacteriales bacterium]|nr:chorismate synthase [Flavobacteriales bacterium]